MHDEAPQDPYELIEQLAPDPARVPSLVGFDGYIGSSSQEGHVRLYYDLSLSYWLDIPEDGVHHTETRTVAGRFHPITVVWVASEADVRPQLLDNQDEELRSFLEGPFTAGGLLEAELPGEYQSDTGVWCNHLKGTIRHDRRTPYWSRCR
jgi:hypothetical protein